MAKFKRYQIQSLIGIFLGYAFYYVVRNNFTLSLPYLKTELHFNNTQVGLMSSLLLISYGLSKGLMSILSDKANPAKFMATGLALCVLMNFIMGFSTNFYIFVIAVILLGVFQGMGVGPSIVTVGHWFPQHQRGRASTTWNVSHNVGGGLAAPLTGAALGIVGSSHWRLAIYIIPACIALIGVLLVALLVKKSPVEEGFKTVEEEYNEPTATTSIVKPDNMTSFGIFWNYVVKNKNAWYLVGVDVFTYMVRFGMLTWIPLYLVKQKGFTQKEMVVTFMLFEIAAIPTTLIGGYLADKFFKNKIMYLPMICLVIITGCILGYDNSSTVGMITIFSTLTGCLIYIPQSMVAIQAMEVLPSFSLGGAVGLRGLCSYLIGSSLGTTLFGFVVDHFGWDSGIYTLMVGAILCFIFCLLSHLGLKSLIKKQATETVSNA